MDGRNLRHVTCQNENLNQSGQGSIDARNIHLFEGFAGSFDRLQHLITAG